MVETNDKVRKSLGFTVEQLCRLFNKNGPSLRRLTLVESRTQDVSVDRNKFNVTISGGRVALVGALNERNRQVVMLSICVNRRFQADFWPIAFPTILSILRIVDGSFTDGELETLIAALGVSPTASGTSSGSEVRKGLAYRWRVKSEMEFALDIFPASMIEIDSP